MAQLNHFWRLICRGFCILMSHNGQVKKSCAFSGCAKIVFWLHTARTENQDTPQTHSGAFVFYEYHSDTPRHPTDTSRHPTDTSREHDMQTDNNRRQLTPPDILKQHLSVSWDVWQCLLATVGMLCSLDMSVGCLKVSVGCLGVSEW